MSYLNEIKSGENCEIVSVVSDNCNESFCKNDFVKRMANLGIREGKILTMMKNSGSGPLLIMVDGNRVAIGRKMAFKIEVKDFKEQNDSK